MKSILITAPSSGSGKTTLTMGLLRAMKNMGLDVCAFKTGPDYIDRAFLEKASGSRAVTWICICREGKAFLQRFQ